MSFTNVQLTHHVPCDNGEVSRVRTGYEMTIAQRTSDLFSVSAKDDGKVLEIDSKLNLLKVQYKDAPAVTSGLLTFPYTESALKTYKEKSIPLKRLATSQEILKFNLGTSFTISKDMIATVSSFERVGDIDSIDADLAKKYKDVIAATKSGNSDAVYIVYFTLKPALEKGAVDIFQFGDKYSFVSGSYLRQPLRINVKEGESFKRGDILVYNSGFFDPDPYSKQVGWKHGVIATVALMEKGETLEDGCLISRALGDDLKMSPAHVRTLSFPNDTAVRQVLPIGTDVESTDLLCSLEEGDLDALTTSDDPDTIAFLSELSRKSPRSKYHGKIVDIQLYYACAFEQLHPTIQDIVRKIERQNKALQNAYRGSIKEGVIKNTTQVPQGLKYHGVEFDATTVVLEFTISEDISCNAGDKLVVANANKTVISGVMEKQYTTRSGIPVDVLFASTSLYNRIVISPFVWGIMIRISEKMEENVLSMYFD